MDVLIWIHRKLDSAVDRVHLRPLAKFVYRRLLALRYGTHGLAVAAQNDRVWKLHHEVILRGEFQEFDTILWLRSVIQPGDFIMDIGANIGQMTLEAATLTGPNGKVIAIEPAPGNVKLLELHVRANCVDDRVQVIEAACGVDHGTTTSFYIVGPDKDAIGSGHTLNCQAVADMGTVCQKVNVVSIDGICRETGIVPAVIKIDVEGGELDVLRGAKWALDRYRPRVRFGFHPFGFDDPIAATREIRQLLATCGYNTPEPVGHAYNLEEYEAMPVNGTKHKSSASK